MTFDISAIAIFGLGSVIYAGWLPARLRATALHLASLGAIYWFQPPSILRSAGYLLPTAVIVLAAGGWWLTRPADGDDGRGLSREDKRTLFLTGLVVVAIALTRYLPPGVRLIASRPPPIESVFLGLLAIAGIGLSLGRRSRDWAGDWRRRWMLAAISAVILLFVLMKTASLNTALSGLWRQLTGRDPGLASPQDLNWLGFSFVAFRLIHTFRDRLTGLLPTLSLREYLTYIIFFPTFTAGPIDRAERFAPDMRALPGMTGLDPGRFWEGWGRIASGLFKKFVLADSLAQGLSLDAANAAQANSTMALWLLLYGYAIRLYLDFAGYSDIAIGLGRLYGFRLPENFNRPYLKSNITAFWQSWHMTLSNWARFYVFTPLSRWLLGRRRKPPAILIVLSAQATTMSVIGLWHGVSLNFLVWGLWHALALFGHKLWSDRTRKWYRGLARRPRQKAIWNGLTWFLTFQYVTLGWVWFALPSIDLSLSTFDKLFNLWPR